MSGLQLPQFKRLPNHIGIIPDGNRRWAEARGLNKECGYANGIGPGLQLYEFCRDLGIKELTFYGFTQDNTKRPLSQKKAFKQACIDAVLKLSKCDAALRVIGNVDSPSFPRELIPYTNRISFGKGSIKINFLVNYGWQWDLNYGLTGLAGKGTNGKGANEKRANEIGAKGKSANEIGAKGKSAKRGFYKHLASSDVSRVDLIIRWGGRRRLSGFLPVQSIYSDFYIIDDYWPDFTPEHLFEALRWYEEQDITLGG